MVKKQSMRSVLNEQLKLITPDAAETRTLKALTREFIAALRAAIRKEKIGAEVFIGGSFAKDTLVKKDMYDVDVFVRFDWRYDAISDMLASLLKHVAKSMNAQVERLHGSRDYFKVLIKNQRFYFEVIPVTKIAKPHEERNVTDLSYFHVPYVKKRITGLEDELRLAKTFLHAQKVYGAETYVQGFSGYAVECLIIHYGSFVKMLRGLVKVKIGERLVIDLAKHYKKNEVFLELNESKLHSPVILIDPTYKERNALASLSVATFVKFQKAAAAFLKRPSVSFFETREVDVSALQVAAKRSKAEFVHVQLQTGRQAGDIAGTKLKKFSEFLERELSRYFVISRKEFHYDDAHTADVYVVAKSRKEIVRIGPPLHMKKFVRAFQKEHMQTYEKNKAIHAKVKVTFGAAEYVDVWKKANRKTLKEMGITKLVVKS